MKKRFVPYKKGDKEYIADNDCIQSYGFDGLCEMLNEFNDENKELKKENEQLKKARDESDKFIRKKGLGAEFLNWCVAEAENDE